MKHYLGPRLAPGEEDKQIGRLIGTCLRCGKKNAFKDDDDCHGFIVPEDLPPGRTRDLLVRLRDEMKSANGPVAIDAETQRALEEVFPRSPSPSMKLPEN